MHIDINLCKKNVHYYRGQIYWPLTWGHMEVILCVFLLHFVLYYREYIHWPLTSWGRVEVIRYAFAFLVSFGHSCEQVQPVLCSHPVFGALLKSVTLEAPEVGNMQFYWICGVFFIILSFS